MARRFFVKSSNIFDDKIVVEGQEHFHISKVLRYSVFDEVLVSSFDGVEYECKIVEIKKDKTVLSILSKHKLKPSNFNITLFQAIIKGERMEWAVEKCTELGVASIVPFLSSFTTVKKSDNKKAKLLRVAVEACKQSGRALVPQLSEVLEFDKVLDLLKNYDQIVLAYENETAPLKDVLNTFDAKKSIAILVGSEGGFSKEEVEKLKSLGAKSVSLGGNILRAETAAVALTCAVLYHFDMFKKQ